VRDTPRYTPSCHETVTGAARACNEFVTRDRVRDR
jgi:hypothetical protein